MGIEGIDRIRILALRGENWLRPNVAGHITGFIKKYLRLTQKPEEIIHIEDIVSTTKKKDWLTDEVDYLNKVSKEIGRKLTDLKLVSRKSTPNTVDTKYLTEPSLSMVKRNSLFKLIKKTSEMNGGNLVSATKTMLLL